MKNNNLKVATDRGEFMSQSSLVILALLMLGCGPTTEHQRGTCSGSAGIHQAGSNIPYPPPDAGPGDTPVTTADADLPLSDAGLSTTDTPTSQPNGDTG